MDRSRSRSRRSKLLTVRAKAKPIDIDIFMADTAYGRFMDTNIEKKDAARFITERRPKMRARPWGHEDTTSKDE